VREGDGTVLWSRAPDIPDEGDLQARYDASALSASDGETVDPWPDETGNGNDLTGGTPTYSDSSINGGPVLDFTGQTEHTVTFSSTLDQPYTIFIVFRWSSTNSGGNNQFAWITPTNDVRLQDSGNGGGLMYAGSTLRSGTIDTNYHIYSLLYDGTLSEFRKDGTTVASGDVGASIIETFNPGVDAVEFGELLIYPTDKSAIYSDVEQYLSNKWGITL
jgi:hypothetical protein